MTSGWQIFAGIATIIVVVGLQLPWAIASIVMGAVHPGKCDVSDSMGINVADWLLGSGVAALVFSIVSGLLAILFFIEIETESILVYVTLTFQIIFGLAAFLFDVAWIIVGGVILFRSNRNCIDEASAIVVFALVNWILLVIALCWHGRHVCSCKLKVDV